MNRPIVRLYGLVVVLFAVLVAFTSRWTIFQASSLRTNTLNERGLLDQERIDRGEILAAGGEVLARSVRDSEGFYTRIYPTGALFTPAIGYSSIGLLAQTGLERYRSAALNGETGTSVQSMLNEIQGRKPQGNTVYDHATANRSACGDRRARRTRRRGGGAAPTDRGGRGDGLHAELRRRRAHLAKRLRTDHKRARCATGQPRRAIWLRARLDVQGGDRHRRDRLRVNSHRNRPSVAATKW